MPLAFQSLVTTIMEMPGLRKVDHGEDCYFCGTSCWGAGVSFSHTRLGNGVVPRCSVVRLCLSLPENHVPLWFPSNIHPFFLQVTTLSDLQPYMSQFLKHLQDSDASALRNSVVIEQVLWLPINGPHLGGELSTFTWLLASVQECDQHAPG